MLSKADKKNLEAFVQSLNIDAQVIRAKLEEGDTAGALAWVDTLQDRLTKTADYFEIRKA